MNNIIDFTLNISGTLHGRNAQKFASAVMRQPMERLSTQEVETCLEQYVIGKRYVQISGFHALSKTNDKGHIVSPVLNDALVRLGDIGLSTMAHPTQGTIQTQDKTPHVLFTPNLRRPFGLLRGGGLAWIIKDHQNPDYKENSSQILCFIHEYRTRTFSYRINAHEKMMMKSQENV